jgi:hypothetical protein
MGFASPQAARQVVPIAIDEGGRARESFWQQPTRVGRQTTFNVECEIGYKILSFMQVQSYASEKDRADELLIVWSLERDSAGVRTILLLLTPNKC